jgi:hypothetical protein
LLDSQRPDPIRQNERVVTFGEGLGHVRQGRADGIDRRRVDGWHVAEKRCGYVG